MTIRATEEKPRRTLRMNSRVCCLLGAVMTMVAPERKKAVWRAIRAAVGAVEDVALVVVATEAAHALGEVRDVDELVDEFFDLWIEGGGHGYLAPSSVVGFPV